MNSIKKIVQGKSKIGFPIFIFIISLSFQSFGQKSEIGAGIGALSYTGELSSKYNILENRPGGLVYFRDNISDVVSLRYGLSFGNLQGTDDSPEDIFAANRMASFDIFMIEPSVIIEYNFLDYKDKNSIIDFSPYFFAGAGFFTFFGQEPSPAEYSNVQPAIPFGIGLKYNIDWHWRLNFEFGARMTFFDYLDNVSEPQTPAKNYQYGNPFNNDAYYFFGISLSYAFYPVICPYDYNN